MHTERKIFDKKFLLFALPIMLVLWAIFYNDLLFGSGFIWEDQLNYFYPLRMFAAESFSKWGITFWNPRIFAGVPFIADIQTAYFYPTNIIFNLIYSLSGGIGYGGYIVFTLVHMLLMSVATYIAVRLHKASVLKSLFFAIFYTYAAFNTLHFIHFSFIQTTLLFPLIISLFAKYFDGNNKKIGVLLAGSIGISFLGGYAQYLYGLMIFLGIFWVYNVHTTKAYKNRKSFVAKLFALIYIGLGVSLAFFQWIPTMDFVKETTRKDLTLQDSQISSVDYKRVINLVSPRFFGEISPDSKTKKSAYWWGSRVQYEYWETAMFFGVIPLMFFIFTLIGLNRKDKILSTVALLFIMGLMLGKNFFLYELFFNYFPGFDMFRNAGRYSFFLLLFVFSMLLFRFDETFEKFPIKKALITGGIVSLFSIIFYFTTAYPHESLKAFSLNQIAIAILFIGVAVAVFKINKANDNIFWLIVIVALFADLKLADANFSSEHGQHPDAKHGAAQPARQFISTDSEQFRVKTRTARMMTWERNSGMLNGIETIEGYNPLMLKDFYVFWFVFKNEINAEMLNVKYALDATKGQYVRLNQWERYFFTNNIIIQDTILNYNGMITKQDARDQARFAIVKNDLGISKFDKVNQKIDKIFYEPDRQIFKVETPVKSLFVLNEVYFKNFKAKIDGNDAKVIKANGIHRSVVVEPGEHTIEFYYDTKIFMVGAAVSFGGLIVLALLYFLSKEKREKQK